jgi:hypothetical protein
VTGKLVLHRESWFWRRTADTGHQRFRVAMRLRRQIAGHCDLWLIDKPNLSFRTQNLAKHAVQLGDSGSDIYLSKYSL